MTLLRAAMIGLMLVGLGACAEHQISTYPTLANQGMLPLSTNNAFVGANLFVAEEAQLSSYLYKFLSAKGAPMAIELNQTNFAAPQMLMFYPKDQEVYAAMLRQTEFEHQWIIRGPYEISREDYRNLQGMQMSMNGEPLFQIYGKPHRFKFSSGPVSTAKSHHLVEPEIPVIPAPTPTPKPKAKVIHKAGPDGGPKPMATPKSGFEPSDDPKNFVPLNTDQQAIAISRGYAERATNGDVIHRVKDETETLEAITNWYTGSLDHLAEIAASNQLTSDQKMAPGTTVRIPLNLLKRIKAMPKG